MILNILKNITPYFIIKLNRKRRNKQNSAGKTYQTLIYSADILNSYSQSCEDIILDTILNKSDGFYIDIGANEPTHLNNTKRFYTKGWSGINIEPNPIVFNKLLLERGRDINLNIGIAGITTYMTFYELSDKALSSFNKQNALENALKYKQKIVNKYRIKTITLNDLFHEYVFNKKVDFLSIDTEGLELEILNGNNWEKNRPRSILIETGNKHNLIYNILTSKDYFPVHFNYINAIFIDKLDSLFCKYFNS